MRDQAEVLEQARRAARACEMAARQMAEFVERSSAVLEPAELAEYETLLAREESLYAARQDALHELGLVARSLEEPTT